MSALAMFLLVMFGLTGSCGGGPADRSNTLLPSSSLAAATRFTSASVISPRSPRNPTKSSGRQEIQPRAHPALPGLRSRKSVQLNPMSESVPYF